MFVFGIECKEVFEWKNKKDATINFVLYINSAYQDVMRYTKIQCHHTCLYPVQKTLSVIKQIEKEKGKDKKIGYFSLPW